MGMTGFLKMLARGKVLVFDGAMGTMLQAAGLEPGECPELWNLTHADAVRHILQAYRDAGSDAVTANTFGGTRYKLDKFGLADQLTEINRAAAELARDVVGGDGYVAGDIGPTGLILEDEGGEAAEDDVFAAFAEQVAALAAGGVDVFLIETFMSTMEASLAIKAARETGLPVICTFTFEMGAQGARTLMGADPARAAKVALDAGANVVGANCGMGIAQMAEIVSQLHAGAPGVPLMVQPNAGLPVVEDGKTVFKQTPDEMASYVRGLLDAGINIIGGCCGTTPEHIAAIARIVKG